jgi:methanethiol S-methyltransferase
MIFRILGTLLALTAHVLLGITVWYLFPFLMNCPVPDEANTTPNWLWRDGLLMFQFGLLHSALLRPAVRDRLEQFLPPALFGCFFTVSTCSSLLLLIHAWQPYPVAVWQLTGAAKWAVHTAYFLSWAALVYSLSLSGFGYQTGWTPYWAWVRGHPQPSRRFEVRGAYRLLRHPVYLSFLGQVWFTPLMTIDRALLTGLLTIYIFMGSYLKDQRLVFYLGEVYRRYQAKVPGYPLGVGPLGRVSISRSEPVPEPAGPS